MLIAIAIIGILAAVGIPQYKQYKIRGYDASAKQALHDIHLLCNAYWTDTYPSQGCDLPIIKDATYGFNQDPDVCIEVPTAPRENFRASAKHNSSPNTYSIDSASLISDTGDCGKAQEEADWLSKQECWDKCRTPEGLVVKKPIYECFQPNTRIGLVCRDDVTGKIVGGDWRLWRELLPAYKAKLCQERGEWC